MENLTFKPTQDYVVFEVPMTTEKTKAGIIKSPTQIKEEEDAKDRFLNVLAIGESVKNIKVGNS